MRELLKAVLKTGSGSIGTVIFATVVIKIMAVVLGPSGVGLYSLLRQINEFSSSLTLGGQMAVVQGLASRKGEAREHYLVTTFWLFVLSIILITILFLGLAPWIGLWVFGNDERQTINLVRWLALPTALALSVAYLNGILNGHLAVGRVALFQALGAAAMALLAYPASRLVEVGYPVAFIGLMTTSFALRLTLGTWSVLRAGWLAPLLQNLRISVHPDSFRQFFSFAGVTLITGLVGTGAILSVRALVVRHSGLVGAGFFDVAWTLSWTYVWLIWTSFQTYYLPTLSAVHDPLGRIELLQRVSRLATLLVVPVVIGIIVFAPLVITIVYSSEFAPSLEIVRWMLIGAYFKVAAYVFSMPVLAYADMKVFFWTELLWYGGFLAFAALALFGFDSMQGIGVGFLIISALCLAYYVHYVRSRHQYPFTRGIIVPWVIGLALIVGASWHTWSETRVNWFAALLWIGVAVSLSWLSLNRNERRETLRTLLRREHARS